MQEAENSELNDREDTRTAENEREYKNNSSRKTEECRDSEDDFSLEGSKHPGNTPWQDNNLKRTKSLNLENARNEMEKQDIISYFSNIIIFNGDQTFPISIASHGFTTRTFPDL
ncbi:hypothetical protein RUM44_006622 [Polyplax serrata]|uniref:Uncharacterized protein n=1 Tax=Polyplax serrata TaxID=468196 RepID=A0ABR1AIL7_POLSC